MTVRKRGSVVLVLLMFVSVVTAATAHVTLRLGVVRLGYAIGERTKERVRLEERQRKLRLEYSRLRDPARIEQLAREQLGMQRPDPSRIRVIRPGVRELAAVERLPR